MEMSIPTNAITNRISGTLELSLRTSARRSAGLSASPPFRLAAYSALRLPMSTPRGLDKSAATHLSPARPVPTSARRLPASMGR